MKRRHFFPHAVTTVTVILITTIAVIILAGCFGGSGGAPLPSTDADVTSIRQLPRAATRQ